MLKYCPSRFVMNNFGKNINKLLKKFKTGKLEAFEELYKLTYLRLMFIAHKYLKCKSDCEDIVAETFTSVYKSIHTFDESQNGYAWLCKIAENKAYNYNRKYIETEELNEQLVANDNVYTQIEAKCIVDSLLDNLSPDEQELILLRFSEDRTLRSIAEEKGLSVNEVNNKLVKIFKKLKKFAKTKKIE